MSQETVCGSHENDKIQRVVMVEGVNMLTLIERGLEAPMAGRVAKNFTEKCGEIDRLTNALRVIARGRTDNGRPIAAETARQIARDCLRSW